MISGISYYSCIIALLHQHSSITHQPRLLVFTLFGIGEERFPRPANSPKSESSRSIQALGPIHSRYAFLIKLCDFHPSFSLVLLAIVILLSRMPSPQAPVGGLSPPGITVDLNHPDTTLYKHSTACQILCYMFVETSVLTRISSLLQLERLMIVRHLRTSMG